MLRLINRVLSPGGARGRLAIMIFHRVLPAPDALLPYEQDATAFEARMRDVRRWFDVIPLAEGVRRLQEGTLPPRALALTFDDGYADNHDVAAPILRRLGLHATFFVATAFLDGGCMWNDRVIDAIRRHRGEALDLRELGLGALVTDSAAARIRAIDDVIARLKYEPPPRRAELAERIAAIAGAMPAPQPMMTSAQLRALEASGFDVGAHTHSHPILAALDTVAAQAEIARGKDELEAIVGRTVRLFAYPNGKPGTDYTPTHVDQARALGFVAACSTAAGVATREADVMQLPRFTPWDRTRWMFGARLSRNLSYARHASG